MLLRTATLLAALVATTYCLAQTTTGTITHDGGERNYRLYVPSSYQAGVPMPFVYNLHGLGSNALEQELYSGMNAVAESEGFIVCYPNGVNAAWNVGFAFNSPTDDVGFLNALVDTLSATYSIDQSRVYSCGMSNGGYMSYKLACEVSDRYAAVASVTGAMVPSAPADCSPSRAVPTLQIHGTNDLTVPYEGSSINVPIETLVEFWATLNSCESDPDTTDIADTDPDDGTTATRYRYDDCTDGNEVHFYKITDGGHTWPGGAVVIGPTNYDIDASTVIWEFFEQFSTSGTTPVQSIAGSPAQPLLLTPNPATDQVRVAQYTTDAESLTLYDATGSMWLTQTRQQADWGTLDVSQLPRGVYFVQVRGRGGMVQVGKVVVE